ncbi:MAG: hypothetical protein DMG65_00715 [Candidatus Angelobacter sp. Gp1-AA117]|nr:MAG: hypothetical protein DMG65_00715 [Candidatus Angelobacter sp. Gp1-AA117]
MIPKIIHLCFGMSPDFGGKPWSLVHHVCLASAIKRIKPSEVLLHCTYEPDGPWWDLSRSFVTVCKMKAPDKIFGNPLRHVAHRADIVRLEQLLQTGGIYLDADVFVHRDFDSLLGNSTVMGEECENGATVGLGNSVILAEPQAPFLKRWYAEYRWFRSGGLDRYWDEHSVRVPYCLAKQSGDHITILPDTAFFSVPCTSEGLSKLFQSPEPIELSTEYASHLWETLAWDPFLQNLTPGKVRAQQTNFHQWARPFIEMLPDNYGSQGAECARVETVNHLYSPVPNELFPRELCPPVDTGFPV